MDDDLSRRVQQVAESLLENEALTIDLETGAAQALLDWGLDCVKRIVSDTAGLDEAAAEEVMAPRIRAMRRLMRQVNRWVGGQREAGAEPAPLPLSQMLEQAGIIYGEAFTLPDAGQLHLFLAQNAPLLNDPQQLIIALRHYIEGFDSATTQQPGSQDG